MKLSRFARRIVASGAGLMLLLYLSTGAAQACMLSVAGPQDTVVSELCCGSASETSLPAGPDCCQEHYLAQQASPAVAKIAVLDTAELPIITASLDTPFITECTIAAATSSPPHIYSPPLHTLYCRLRN